MRKIKVNLEYLIGNAMIEIYKKDRRRIIDTKDLTNYKELVIEEFNKQDIQPNFTGNDDKLYDAMSNYFCTFKGDYIAILPWVSMEELIERYRKDMPLEVYRCFSNPVINDGLLERNEDELKRFISTDDIITNIHLNNINTNINELELKKQKEANKLEKIKTIRNNKI